VLTFAVLTMVRPCVRTVTLAGVLGAEVPVVAVVVTVMV
jgi:hypothetical protein